MSQAKLSESTGSAPTLAVSKPIALWQMAVLAAIFLAIYFPVLEGLVQDWLVDGNYSHGFLIIPISAFIVWRKRHRLKEIPIETSNWGLLLLGGSLLLLLVGVAGAEFFTTRVSMIGVLAGMTLYLTGWRFTREIWFAFFFLLFMIPVPYIIYYSATFPLQLFGSKVASVVIGLIGIPHLRQGNIIHLPDNYSLEVAEACSGLRSLVTLLALAALLAYLTQNSKFKSVILFLSAIPIAIGANVFRITVTAIGAYGISRKVADEVVHEMSGMIVFGFTLVCLLIFGSILRAGKLE
jgi:exosortase